MKVMSNGAFGDCAEWAAADQFTYKDDWLEALEESLISTYDSYA